MKNKIYNKSGMTLIETVIALGILTVGIFSTLTLTLSAINFSRNSEQMIVVVNLAREGLEMARSIRELNGFSALTAGNNLTNINYLTNDLELIHADNADIANCNNCYLEFYDGRYMHNTPATEVTNFKRLVTITDESSTEKKVKSQVYWTLKDKTHIFTLETYLTDW